MRTLPTIENTADDPGDVSAAITPVAPTQAAEALGHQADAKTAGRRTFGRKLPSRRTFGRKRPSRRTFGRRLPSRRTFGYRRPSRRTFGFRRP